MSSPTYRPFPFLWLLIALSSCSSTSSFVDNDEEYRGPMGAAVLPVGGAGHTAPSHGRSLGEQIQRLIVRNLETAGIFAHVDRLTTANAANEAEVLIEPVLLELRWHGAGYRQGQIRLRVKATQKSDRGILLDKTYEGDCRDCRVPPGVAPVAGPLEKPLQQLTKDLRRKMN